MEINNIILMEFRYMDWIKYIEDWFQYVDLELTAALNSIGIYK